MLITYTPEEQQHINEVQASYKQEWEALEAKINDATDTEERNALVLQYQAIYESMVEVLDAFSDKCQRERFEAIKAGGADAIIENAKQQTPIMLQSMHRETAKLADNLTADDLQKAGMGTIKKSTFYINADYAIDWLKSELRLHIDALMGDKAKLKELLEAVIEEVNESPLVDNKKSKTEVLSIKHLPLSITPDSAIFKANMPMYHGKATDALAAFSSRDVIENPITDKGTIQTADGDFKIVIQDFSKIKGKYSINAHKLLCTGIAEFTQVNNYGGGAVIPTIAIPFNEYARLLGYEIDERETDSPEAAAKEKKRAAEAVKTAKKRTRQDLELLQAMRWTWQESIKGKGTDFDSILLFERVAIRKGYIIMEFGRNMAEYLKKTPLTQYPRGLLAIDARSENAYRLGLKMAEHFNVDNNQLKGTANRLKVSTLLAVTQLPTYETLQQETPDDSRHWDRRIKEPFETALDALTGKVIKNWEYVKAKGETLTDPEAYGIADYETFKNLLVQFELLEAPNHDDRLARRAEEKKTAEARKAQKGKKSKKKQ